MLLVQCPHCEQMIEVIAVNCKIFRCGVYRDNFVQIPPHLPKENCDELVLSKRIFGCGKPFMLDNGTAVICAYI
jgi:hypothetical protein